MQVIQRVAEHYDTQEIEFGRIYRWCPECVVVECDCGERMTLRRLDIIIASKLTCEECGAKVSPRIREEVVIELLDEDDAAIHPWHHDNQAQAEQHLHDETAYPEDSPWRFDEVTTSGFVDVDEERWKKARAR